MQDLDGDGLDDLVVPEPDGYRVLYQDRSGGKDASFQRTSFLRMPAGVADGGLASVRRGESRSMEVRRLANVRSDSASSLSGPSPSKPRRAASNTSSLL